jgi:hypothetical protein
MSLRHTALDFQRSIANFSQRDVRRFIYDAGVNVANIPREFVSFHFGWKQLYRDYVELLQVPAKITREVNRLIERKGKPTTFVATEKYPLPSKSLPGFDYFYHERESDVVMATDVERIVEFRLVVNAIFQFPNLAVPELREKLYLQKYGVAPTATDVYNLIPWTWLVDWFTGLGDYVEAIDAINTDESTFNYGFLTGKITGKIKTTRDSQSLYGMGVFNQPPGTWGGYEYKLKFNHTSTADYELTIRKDIASAYDAKTTLKPSSLTTYQQSIISSILADKTGVRKLVRKR